MTDPVKIAMIATAGPTLIGIVQLVLAFFQRKETQRQHIETRDAVNEYHKEVNNKMDQLIAVEKKDSRAEGNLEGKAELRAEMDSRK